MLKRDNEKPVSRRMFVKSGLIGLAATPLAVIPGLADSVIPDSVVQKNLDFAGDKGDQLEPALVQEFVRLSHFDFESVKSMAAKTPSLTVASWDWGGGDFETGLGAASHVGNRSIAQFLLDHGARPNLFSAAMLGQLSVVQGYLTYNPELANCRGPHGLSLLHHAQKGGQLAKPIVELIESLLPKEG